MQWQTAGDVIYFPRPEAFLSSSYPSSFVTSKFLFLRAPASVMILLNRRCRSSRILASSKIFCLRAPLPPEQYYKRSQMHDYSPTRLFHPLTPQRLETGTNMQRRSLGKCHFQDLSQSRATGSGRAIPRLSLNPRHYDSQPKQAASNHPDP